jgi:apolipoprotein N-acyltransferase
MKVDFMKSVKANALLINRYRLWTQKEKIIGFGVIIPAVIFLAVWLHVSMHANAFQWITLVCVLLLGIFLSYYIYKRVYERHIETIRKNLDELADNGEQ